MRFIRRERVMGSSVLVGALIAAGCSSFSDRGVAGMPTACSSSTASVVVYALGGSVYRVGVNGWNRCLLTSRVAAKEPRLAPGAKLVAFLSGTGSNGSGNAARNVVRVVRVGGPLSVGDVVRGDRGLHGRLAWSPDGKRLAFVDGGGLWVWSAACRCSRKVMPGTPDTSLQSFAWSPDSRQVAAALVSSSWSAADRLTVSIGDVATGARHTVVIHFPASVRGRHPYQGSYPSQVIAWPRNGELLIGTSGWGMGAALTGVWMGSLTGGMARMIVGGQKSWRSRLKSPLYSSTQALVSPDGRRLLTDPWDRFWIASASGRRGRMSDLPMHGSCALAQVAWVGNAAVAYVTVCKVGGMNKVTARLYVLRLIDGKSRLLAAVRSVPQDSLSIAPGTRCITCGAG